LTQTGEPARAGQNPPRNRAELAAPPGAGIEPLAAGQQGEGGYRPGYEVTAERILQYIAESGLRPGDRLPTELDLARQLSVSRTVTREAIKILSAIGRVRAHKGRGLYVADEPGMLGAWRETQFLPANLGHVFMLFEFRRTQEAELSRLAATRATPAELRAIEEAAHQCRHAADQQDPSAFHLGDDSFHLGIATASHNPFLKAALQTARRLQNQSSILARSGTIGDRVHKAAAEHTAIYQAIREGRPDDAATAAALHINNSLDDYNQEIHRRLLA
jgi:GntR family transcriptional regulator, transcriptional repressor for pyruvate dehydrogenase complex